MPEEKPEEPKENAIPEEPQKPKEEKHHQTEEEKHKRLLLEKELEAKRREQLKDYRRNLVQHGKHIFDKRRKDKFLGGTKGRRGG